MATSDLLEQRVKVPSDWSDWLGADFRGVVRYTRSFNKPTGLTQGHQVWLELNQVDYSAKVFLNTHPLGSLKLGETFRHEVIGMLELSNQLVVEVEMPEMAERTERSNLAGGLIGSVCLELCEVFAD